MKCNMAISMMLASKIHLVCHKSVQIGVKQSPDKMEAPRTMIKSLAKNTLFPVFCVIIPFALVLVAPVVQREYLSIQPKSRSIPLPIKYEGMFQTIDIANPDGDLLKSWYSPTRNGATVILLHGYGGDRMQMLPEADLLMEYGFGVLIFDSRAQGESGGKLITYGLEEAKDISSAVNWLMHRPEVRKDKVAALGFSNGATALVLHAANDKRLAAFVLCALPSSLFDLTYDEGGSWPWVLTHLKLLAISLSVVGNAYASNSQNVIDQISPRPLLLVYGQNDEVVPPERVEKILKNAREPKSSLLLPNSGHGSFILTDQEIYSKAILKFYSKSLNVELMQRRNHQ